MVHRNIYTHSIENTHKSNTSVTTTHILKHTAQREARGGAPEHTAISLTLRGLQFRP